MEIKQVWMLAGIEYDEEAEQEMNHWQNDVIEVRTGDLVTGTHGNQGQLVKNQYHSPIDRQWEIYTDSLSSPLISNNSL